MGALFAAFGRTYQTRSDAQARVLTLQDTNARYGDSDDRVTEINALQAALAAEPVYTVERGDYPMPCQHPLCEQLHQRFMTTETVSGLAQTGFASVWVTEEVREHEVTVRQWIILRDGERVGNAHDTKREALAEAATRPTH